MPENEQSVNQGAERILPSLQKHSKLWGARMNLTNRTRRLVIFGIVCASVVVVTAQAQSAAGHVKVSLDLGTVTVWLGMPQSDVLLQFQSAGYRVTGEGDTRTVSIGDSPAMIGFQNGRLKYATREWYTPGQDEMDVVIRALTDLASHGGTFCSIVPDRMNTPGGSRDTIFVRCGERSLMFVKGEAVEKTGVVPVVEVQERIGVI